MMPDFTDDEDSSADEVSINSVLVDPAEDDDESVGTESFEGGDYAEGDESEDDDDE